VFILKGVEVVCFDTFLQVLILKVLARANECRFGLAMRLRMSRRFATGIPPPCLAKRGGKLLKTKEAGQKKRGKRVQEAPSH
jgi:hypothetical protein